MASLRLLLIILLGNVALFCLQMLLFEHYTEKLLRPRLMVGDKGWHFGATTRADGPTTTTSSLATTSKEGLMPAIRVEKTRQAIVKNTNKQPQLPKIKIPQPKFVNIPGSAINQRTNDPRVIYFLHIHKSGGTNMCKAARANNETAAATNCNPQQDQRCCGGGDSLFAQQFFVQVTNFTFVANERDMYSAMDLKNYRYVVMLRNSLERYKSHWKNVCRVHGANQAGTFTSWWTRQPDNWSVRKICGTKCIKIPKFHISVSQFEYVLERLRKFEDILFLERFNETFTKFARRVGWTQLPIPVSSYSHFDYPKDSGEWDPLMSALDDALYEYAEALYRGESEPALKPTTQALVHKYFQEGPGRLCTSPCCHTNCSVY